MKLKILEIQQICSRSNQMYGWPGMTRAVNGDILIAASERKFHCGPYGREVIIRSTDNGYTWTQPEEVFNSLLDDRDSNLLTLPDGDILLSWFSSTAFKVLWPERYKHFSKSSIQELQGTWLLKSHDHGITWDDTPLRMPVGCHISPVYLSDGSLLSVGTEQNKKTMSVYKSNNSGKSWYKTTEINGPLCSKGLSKLNENHILEVSPGRLIALFRCIDGYLRQSNSDNYGCIWSKVTKLPIWGYPAQMLKLRNGKILCSYSCRQEPYSIKAVISHDNGQSWDIDNIMELYMFEDQPDMGYPSAIECRDNEILCVFYVSRCDYRLKNSQSISNYILPGNSPEGLLTVRYLLE